MRMGTSSTQSSPMTSRPGTGDVFQDLRLPDGGEGVHGCVHPIT